MDYVEELLRGLFVSYGSFGTWISIAYGLSWLFLPKFNLDGKMKAMKDKCEKLSWSYRILIFLGFVFISVILTSHSIYVNQQQQIDKLQNRIRNLEQIPNPKRTAARMPQVKKYNSKPTQIIPPLPESQLHKPHLEGVKSINEPNIGGN
jgi:hypothetical protein